MTGRHGRCRYCGKRTALTKKGLVRTHWVIAGVHSATVEPGSRVVCGGSGQIPSLPAGNITFRHIAPGR